LVPAQTLEGLHSCQDSVKEGTFTGAREATSELSTGVGSAVLHRAEILAGRERAQELLAPG